MACPVIVLIDLNSKCIIKILMWLIFASKHLFIKCFIQTIIFEGKLYMQGVLG